MRPTKFQFIWPSGFRGDDFLAIDQSATIIVNCLLWPYLLTDQNEMSNRYRESFIDATYQVLVHLAKRLQRRRFFEIDQSETRIACGGHVCY